MLEVEKIECAGKESNGQSKRGEKNYTIMHK